MDEDLKEGLEGVNVYNQVSEPGLPGAFTHNVDVSQTREFIRRLLFMQVLKTLEQLSDQVPYVYDICSNPECAMVYRGEFATAEKCPRCTWDRRHPNSQRAKKKLLYFSIADWLKGLFSNAELAQ